MYKKQRIEALSDGIFGIAMTLLVLNLKVPESFAHGHVWAALKPQGEAWLSFALTFGLAARFWTLQHDVFAVVENVGRGALILTFVFLGLVSVLPFTTSLLGAHFTDPSVLALYFLHELGIALAITAKLEVCAAHGHVRVGVSLAPLRRRLYFMSATLLAGALSALLLPLRLIYIPLLAVGLVERAIKMRTRRAEPQTKPQSWTDFL